jgi:Uncharacterized protein conserved in bacteria
MNVIYPQNQHLKNLDMDLAFGKVKHVTIIETHISWIYLTGKYAYKVKKELKFGEILDFSNLALRKKYCQKEIVLNKPLCGNMYQSVVKLVIQNGKYKFVNLQEKARALEYAVKMLEIPQDFRLDKLLSKHQVTKKTINQLTDVIVKFHIFTDTNYNIRKNGSPEAMNEKIRENFATLSKFTTNCDYLKEKLYSFVERNGELFSNRIKELKIRNIHGDFYSRNIFFKDGKFYIFDRIEFNDVLRYADVAEDVAHFAMDLDFHNKQDLRKYFLYSYIKSSNDTSLENIIYFMMCYKTCVRAKVSLFQAEGMTNTKEKMNCIKDAERHLKLASDYVKLF